MRNAWAWPAALLLVLAVAPLAAQDRQQSAADELVKRLNAYRAQHRLHSIPISPSLTAVAEAHAASLERSPPTGRCNRHSWPPSKSWNACCYTDDHARAQCMWDKPREITAGRYQGAGFEILAWRSGRMTLEFALEGWKASAAHQDVLINKGVWATTHWNAIGAAVTQHYAVVWFGMEPDPDARR